MNLGSGRFLFALFVNLLAITLSAKEQQVYGSPNKGT
jgi:hypothetical protein